MSKVEVLTHKGKSIIYINLSKCAPEDSVAALNEARTIIAKQPPKSALVLTNVTEAIYNKDVASAIKDFVSSNTPFMKASAIVGADGVRQVLLSTVTFITRREIKQHQTIQEAKDWLATF
jgi:hypothetical protein